MSPGERWQRILDKAQHTIPIVRSRFLTDAEHEELRGLQTDDNSPINYPRADHKVVCKVCGEEYWRHPKHHPHAYLTVLCDGYVVKL